MRFFSGKKTYESQKKTKKTLTSKLVIFILSNNIYADIPKHGVDNIH